MRLLARRRRSRARMHLNVVNETLFLQENRYNGLQKFPISSTPANGKSSCVLPFGLRSLGAIRQFSALSTLVPSPRICRRSRLCNRRKDSALRSPHRTRTKQHADHGITVCGRDNQTLRCLGGKTDACVQLSVCLP